MPSFDVTAPNGRVFRVDAPEGATEEQAIAYVANVAYPQSLREPPPPVERGLGTLFGQSFKKGLGQTGILVGDYGAAMLGRGVEAAAEAVGATGVAEAAKGYAERQLEEARTSAQELERKYPTEFRSYEDIQSARDALRYGVEALGTGLPSLLPGIVTGGAGAIAARGLTTAASRAAAIAGSTAVGSAGQTIPEAYATILQETGQERLGPAIVAGGINAALESILPASLVSRFSGPAKEALKASIARRLGLGFAEGATMEGLTEGTQQAINNAAVTFVDSNKEFFTSDNWRGIVDNAIRGAIVGGTVSAATSAVGRGEQAPGKETPPPPSDIERVETPPEVTGEPQATVGGQAEPATQAEPQAEPATQAEPQAEPAAQAEPQAAEPAAPAVEPAAAEPAAVTTAEPPVQPVAPAPVVEKPEPVAEAPRTTDLPIFQLPAPLKGAKPRYSFGTAQFMPQFQNPVDMALYITAQPTKSKQDEGYRDFLKQVGFTEPQITQFGTSIREHIKGLAKEQIDSGVTSGPLPVDYMRMVHGPTYEQIVTKSGLPEAPRPAAPAPQAAAPAAPAPAPKPAAPAPQPTAPARAAQPPILQQPAPLTVKPAARARLEKAAPGSTRLLFELHSRLYPGRSMEVKKTTSKEVLGKMLVQTRPPKDQSEFTLYVNFDKIEKIFKSGDKTQFLKTLFHEFSHPIAYTWVANADAATLDAIVQQYIKERNPSTLQRWGMYRMLEGRLEGKPDEAALDEILNKTGLTRADYKMYAGSTADKALLAKTGKGDIGSNYMRSFPEWVAEKGAQWLTKELEGLVPQTVFQKFQKDILDGLRKVYAEVARLLGIQPTEGAFEQLLRDVYGKKVVAPRPVPFGSAKIPSGLQNREPGLFSAEDLDQLPEPDTTSEAAKKRQAEINSGPKAVTEPFAFFTQPVDKSLPGVTRRAIEKLFDVKPGEPILQAFVRDNVSSMVPFLSSSQELLRNLGKFLENTMSSTGRVMALVDMGPIGYKEGEGVYLRKDTDAKPLLKAFEGVGVKDMDLAQRVAIAQRILAERKAGRDLKFYDAQGVERKMSTQELEAFVNGAPQNVKDALKEFDKLNNTVIDFAVDTGLIPRSLGERFKTLMYTPFYRVQDEALKDNPNITLAGGIYEAIKDPKGVDTFNKKVSAGGPIHGDLYENILRNYNAIVSAGLRNVGYREAAKVLTQFKRKGYDVTIGEVVPKPVKGSIQYRVGGEDRFLVVHDPAMFAAIGSMSPKDISSWVRAVSKFTEITRRGITAAPPFQVRNLIRALVELKVKSGMPEFGILSGTVKGMKDTWRKTGSYAEIVGQTGFGGFGFGSGTTSQGAFVRRTFEFQEKPFRPWTAFLRAFDFLERIGELTEMGPRIAYYDFLKKSGISDQDAAWEAVNLVNYHRHGTGNGVLGSFVTNLIPLVPFLTARIQGLYRLAETGTAGAPKTLIGNGVAGISSAIVTRGLMVTAINMGVNMMYGEEDWYKKLSEKERLSNMYVKVGDVVVALPRSFEIGELFGGLPTLLADNIRKGEGNDFGRGLMHMLGKTFMVEPIPQVAKPIIEVAFNKNIYTGQPIENLSDKQKLVELRYDEYTSSFAKMAAHLTKFINLSPKDIDQLLRGYFGTSATLFLGTVDSLVSQGGTRPGGIFGDPQSVAGVVGNLTGVTAILRTESQLNNRFVGDFYKLKEEITQVVRAMDDAVVKQDIDAVRSYAEANPAARPLYTRFNAVAARLTQINKQMDAIRDNPNLMPEQKMQQLEMLRKLKGDTAQQAVELASKMGVAR